jgi:hypothetical protein
METILISALIISNLLAVIPYARAEDHFSPGLDVLLGLMPMLAGISFVTVLLAPNEIWGLALIGSAAINVFFFFTVLLHQPSANG